MILFGLRIERYKQTGQMTLPMEEEDDNISHD
jgi:hypothetical protein